MCNLDAKRERVKGKFVCKKGVHDENDAKRVREKLKKTVEKKKKTLKIE